MDNAINIDEIGYIEDGILKVYPGVTEIPANSFKNKGLIGVKFDPSVIKIGFHAFANNQIRKVELPPNLKTIEMGAFQSNEIADLKLPPELTSLSILCFAGNKLTNVVIPNNIRGIDLGALSSNPLISINISNSVKFINNSAFPPNVELVYDEIKINKNLIEKFDTNNVIMISKMLKIMPEFNFDIVSKDILTVFPSEIDVDFLKSYITNVKKFNLEIEQLKEKYPKIRISELQGIFKMFYSLGFFKTGGENQKKLLTKIHNIIDYYEINGIRQLFTSIQLTKFQPKFAEVVLNEYKHPKMKEIISRFYREYDKMVPTIRKKKENNIGIINSKYNQATNEVIKKELEEDLVKLKNNKKNIFVDDIIFYTIDQIMNVRPGNEALYSIVPQISPYIDQIQFDKIQDIYEEAVYIEKTSEKYFQRVSDLEQEDFHYFWSPGNNPTNIILGYICNCCAKYESSGEDIMIQSMVNPQIKNLIIYDGIKNVIGKSTAFYHLQGKYIIFNNIEIADRAVKLNQDKKIFDAILRGIYDQITAMREKGHEVNEVRIGTRINKLAQEIERRNLKIEQENLLANYNYKNYNDYSVDDNHKHSGQVIIDIQTERKL